MDFFNSHPFCTASFALGLPMFISYACLPSEDTFSFSIIRSQEIETIPFICIEGNDQLYNIMFLDFNSLTHGYGWPNCRIAASLSNQATATEAENGVKISHNFSVSCKCFNKYTKMLYLSLQE